MPRNTWSNDRPPGAAGAAVSDGSFNISVRSISIVADSGCLAVPFLASFSVADGGAAAGSGAAGSSKFTPSFRSIFSVARKGLSPLSRSEMIASGSPSPSMTRARRNRSMLTLFHGSRATRSSLMMRASIARP